MFLELLCMGVHTNPSLFESISTPSAIQVWKRLRQSNHPKVLHNLTNLFEICQIHKKINLNEQAIEFLSNLKRV